MKNYEFVKTWVLFHLAYAKSNEKVAESNKDKTFTLADIWRFLKLSLINDYPTILELWNLLEDLQYAALVNIDENHTLSKSQLSITSKGLLFLINALKEPLTNSNTNRIKERLYDLWARESIYKLPYVNFNLVSAAVIKERLERYLNRIEKKEKK